MLVSLRGCGRQYVNINAIINPPAASSLRSKESKRYMKINTSSKSGFTLVEIMIVVAIIGLLAAIAIPNFVRARNTSQTNACINNLRQLDGGVQQWALENKKQASDAVALSDIQPYIKLDSSGAIPACPAGGTYAVTTVSNTPTCTISGHKMP
jgi:prepilin-type N-terminal cleavage/methylation domain-containing protein